MTLTQEIHSFFSADYKAARSIFLNMSNEVGGVTTSYKHPKRGRYREDLYTDVTVVGPKDSRCVLLIQSGTHGVEGFCGSAIQTSVMQAVIHGALKLRTDTAIVFVHAINPHGFSWCSRTNEDNIDLNRNFINFDAQEEKRNSLFQEIEPYLVPNKWTDTAIAESDRHLEALNDKYGHELISQSLRKGQYDYPQSLFYGGREPSWSRALVARICKEHLELADKILFLDIHSGLGDFAELKLLSVDQESSQNFNILNGIYGGAVISTANKQSGAANSGGHIIRGYSEHMHDKRFIGMALEFGTYEQSRVQLALRADTSNRFFPNTSECSETLNRNVKDEMLEAFCPSAPSWRSSILSQGTPACQKALEEISNI